MAFSWTASHAGTGAQLVVPPGGRTLSGGGSARCDRNASSVRLEYRRGGSLTILATALIETGSRMDESSMRSLRAPAYELPDRSGEGAFSAIDIYRSGKREELLFRTRTRDGLDCKTLARLRTAETTDLLIDRLTHEIKC